MKTCNTRMLCLFLLVLFILPAFTLPALAAAPRIVIYSAPRLMEAGVPVEGPCGTERPARRRPCHHRIH